MVTLNRQSEAGKGQTPLGVPEELEQLKGDQRPQDQGDGGEAQGELVQERITRLQSSTGEKELV